MTIPQGNCTLSWKASLIAQSSVDASPRRLERAWMEKEKEKEKGIYSPNNSPLCWLIMLTDLASDLAGTPLLIPILPIAMLLLE
jgi:hypothetical protein